MFYESEVLKNHITDLQFGDIILFRRKMMFPIGYFIQMFLGSYYSHSAIYYGYGKIVEATTRGVVITDMDEYRYTKVCVLRLKEPMTEARKKRMKNWIYRTLRKQYDYIAFLYMFLGFSLYKLGLIKKTWRRKRDAFDHPDKYFCFQYVAEGFYEEALFDAHYTNAYDEDFLESDKLKIMFKD